MIGWSVVGALGRWSVIGGRLVGGWLVGGFKETLQATASESSWANKVGENQKNCWNMENAPRCGIFFSNKM